MSPVWRTVQPQFEKRGIHEDLLYCVWKDGREGVRAGSDKQGERGKQPRGWNRSREGEKKGDRFLHVEVRVRCSRGSEKEGIGSQRAGDSHAWSAMKREERRWQVRAVSCPLHRDAALSANPIHFCLSCFTYFLLTALIITVSLSDMFHVSPPPSSRPPLPSREKKPLRIMFLNPHFCSVRQK